MVEPADQVLECGEALRIGHVGVVDHEQHRCRPAEVDHQVVEAPGRHGGIGPGRLGIAQHALEGADLLAKVIPDFLLVLATDRGAAHEAANLDLPLFGMVDSNTDPTPFLYPVYGNDDSVESLAFMLELLKRGVEEGRKREHEAFAIALLIVAATAEIVIDSAAGHTGLVPKSPSIACARWNRAAARWWASISWTGRPCRAPPC